MTIFIPFCPNFKFIFHSHKQMSNGNSKFMWELDRDYQAESRITSFLKSEGGCLLICGRMGVGKTSFVNQMLAKFKQDEKYIVVDINLNVCRPIDSARLKYRLIRKIYYAIKEQNNPVKDRIEQMYIRTLYNHVKEVDTNENYAAINGEFNTNIINTLTAQLQGKVEKKDITTLERILGDYDDIEAEEDLQEIMQELPDSFHIEGVFLRVWRQIKNWVSRIRNTVSLFWFGRRKEFKLIFILDELDKLEVDNQEKFEEIIKLLKGLFSETSSKFILISGRQTYGNVENRVLSEIGSIYDGVVTDTIYLPCIWDELKTISDNIFIKNNLKADELTWYEDYFKYFLVYCSHGSIRRLLMIINTYRHGEHLEITLEQKEVIMAYAAIQKAVEAWTIPLTQDWRPPYRDDFLLEAYRLIEFFLHLNPGDVINIQGDSFTHSGSWLNRAMEPQKAGYGIKLDRIMKILTDLGYFNQENLPYEHPVNVEKKLINQVFRATEKVNFLTHGRIVIRNEDLILGEFIGDTLTESGSYTTTVVSELAGEIDSLVENTTLFQIKFTGSNCVYCRSPIALGDHLILCNTCGAIHHEECWQQQGGCGSLGCSNNPSAGFNGTKIPKW